jgi:hypothetical protein
MGWAQRASGGGRKPLPVAVKRGVGCSGDRVEIDERLARLIDSNTES